MPLLTLYCGNCGFEFSTGIAIAAGAGATFIGSSSRCPRCGNIEQIPDADYVATRDGIIAKLRQSDDPIREAREILAVLREIRNEEDLRTARQHPILNKIERWIPNDITKLTGLIAMIVAIITILTQQHSSQTTIINNNNTTVNTYQERPKQHNKNPMKFSKKIGRNDPCPCGSGKKFKHCHGVHSRYYP